MAFPENTVNDIGIKHIWDKVTAALSGKVDKVSGKGLSTNDYTTAEKEKLSGIEAGAQVNTVTSVAGKTGAVTLDKSDVGLGNVDNTSDLDKPISTATQTALNNKADSGEVEGLKTATGKPITLTDASETYAQGLSVEFEPKQDLHGYDFPWVGGAGKNKLQPTITSQTINGITFTKNSDGSVHITGTSTTDFVAEIGSVEFSEQTGIIYNGISGGTPSTYSINIYAGVYGSDVYEGDSSVHYVSGTVIYYFVIRAANVQIDTTIYPMIRLSTETDPTFAPYSNICPISGYEGVEVDDVGKNEYDEDGFISEYSTRYTKASDGSVETVGTLNSGDVLWENTKGYTGDLTLSFKYKYANTGSAGIRPYVYYTDGTFETIWTTNTQSYNTVTKIFASGGKVVDKITVDFGSSTNKTNFYLQIEKGTTATPYEPYQSRTASVTFGQTVYGGRSDFKGGTDDDRASVDLGSLTWTKDGNDFLSSELSVLMRRPSSVSEAANMLCECFDVKAQSNFETKNGSIAYFYTNSSESVSKVVVYLTDTSLQDFMTIVNGQKIVYEKTTTTTISTPPTDLKLLQDTNNLTTNGTTITLDYIPNNSIGDAVKASEEYTDRAVERVIPKAKLACFYEIFDESGTLYDATIPEDCNFFLVEYRIQNRIGSTLIKAKSIDFYIPVVVNVGGEQHWVEFLYNSIYHTIDYTSNVTTGFGVLSIYTI